MLHHGKILQLRADRKGDAGPLARKQHLPVRPRFESPGLLDRHAAPDRQRQPAHRTPVLVHAGRDHRAVPPDAGGKRFLPLRFRRQRPADRAARRARAERPRRRSAAQRLYRPLPRDKRALRKGIPRFLGIARLFGRLELTVPHGQPGCAEARAGEIPRARPHGQGLSQGIAGPLVHRMPHLDRAGGAGNRRPRNGLQLSALYLRR